jgi:diacylglycerol kinase family enzyme
MYWFLQLAAAETKKQTEQRRWSAEHRNEANKHKYFLLSAGLGLAAYIVWAFRDRNAPKAEP